MTENQQAQPTLDHQMTYEIRIPGMVGLSSSDWTEELRISCIREGVRAPVTVLSGELDQAALHDLLRRLYSMGVPLISATLVEA